MRMTTPSLMTAALALATAACSGGSITIPDAGGGGPVRNTDGSDASTDSDGGVAPGADGGGETMDGSSGPAAQTPPTLEAATAMQAGRNGADVRLTVTGRDVNGDFTSVAARFLNAAGQELFVADTDLDGRADSGRLVMPPKTSHAGEVDFEATVVFSELWLKSSDIREVEVFLYDSLAQTSSTVQVSVSTQPTLGLQEPCDPSYGTDRCAEGLGCRGEPSVCVEGLAPSLDEFAYYQTSRGLRVLMAGQDQDDDIWRVQLGFLDHSGGPVELDLDNDGTPDSVTFDVNAERRSADGSFFVAIEPSATFGSQVPQLSAIPVDSQLRQGGELRATLSQPRLLNPGSQCDPRGFDECLSTAVCAPDTTGDLYRCADKIGLRQRSCTNAPILNANLGTLHIAGVTTGPGLWDAPTGCAALDPTGRPEAAVMLDIPDGARSVTVTTDLPGTGFDTVLYVIAGCALPQDQVLGCSDNVAEGMASTLTFTPVDGVSRYAIIVDSWHAFGGAFELQVTVQ